MYGKCSIEDDVNDKHWNRDISMADDSVVVHLKKGVAKNYVWF